jgi:hypothetical protein
MVFFISNKRKKETLGATWVCFNDLIFSGPDLTIPDPILLQHVYLGLNKETTHYLDIALGGSFLHLSPQGGKDVLNKIAENTPYTGIYG